MRPEALFEARDWLHRAERDLLSSRHTLERSPVLAEIAVFHAQQAAEKALKAFLAAHDQPFPPTHDLVRLIRMCMAIDTSFLTLLEAADTLTPYAVRFRYPPGPVEPDLAEAYRAVQLATQVLEFVRGRPAIGEVPE